MHRLALYIVLAFIVVFSIGIQKIIIASSIDLQESPIAINATNPQTVNKTLITITKTVTSTIFNTTTITIAVTQTTTRVVTLNWGIDPRNVIGIVVLIAVITLIIGYYLGYKARKSSR